MVQAKLKELNMKSRAEAVGFLKKLWLGETVYCPICGEKIEPLHKKSKKNDTDFQCKKCDKTFRTIQLLCEINEQMPV